jgi:ketosteroid isomerase-like protein
MSALEIVRRCCQAYADADYEDSLALFAKDAEWDLSHLPGGRVYRGHEEVWEGHGAWLAAWETYSVEFEEFADLGADRVLAVGHERGRGRGSGVAVEQRIYQVFTVRDGKVAHMQAYLDRGEALAAANSSSAPAASSRPATARPSASGS